MPDDAAITSGAEIFAQACAVRSIALAAVLLYYLAADVRAVLGPLLVLTALTQCGDAVIHGAHGNLPLVGGAALLTAVPAASAWLLAGSS